LFLGSLRELSERFEIDIFAYVLMDNHYHYTSFLLIEGVYDNVRFDLRRADGAEFMVQECYQANIK